MESMFEELYYGNIGFDSGRYGPDSPFVKAARVKVESMEKLEETLNDAEKELFDRFCEAESEIEGITTYDTYRSALKFGILFMMELFTGCDPAGGSRRAE